LKVFLDTSILSERRLGLIGEEISRHRLDGDEFLLSSITYFQLRWGYTIANIATSSFEAFLRIFEKSPP
jgi:hypothetical protein